MRGPHAPSIFDYGHYVTLHIPHQRRQYCFPPLFYCSELIQPGWKLTSYNQFYQSYRLNNRASPTNSKAAQFYLSSVFLCYFFARFAVLSTHISVSLRFFHLIDHRFAATIVVWPCLLHHIGGVSLAILDSRHQRGSNGHGLL